MIIFYDYYLVYIITIVCGTSLSITYSTDLIHATLDRFKKAGLILVAQIKLLFQSNYLKSTVEGLSIQISVVPNASLFLCS